MLTNSNTPRVSRFELQRRRPVEEFVLVWLGNADDNNHEFNELNRILHDIRIFVNSNECINFISEFNTNQKIILIVNIKSVTDHEAVIWTAEPFAQLSIIYILFKENSMRNELEQLYGNHKKIQCILTEMKSFKDHFARVVTNRLNSQLVSFQTMNMASIETARANTSLNKQDASFMYAQLIKELLLEFELASASKLEMIEFCRELYCDSLSELAFINEFENNSENRSPIYFYTAEHFLYRMLNRALRLQEIDKLYHLRYYIRQLNEELKRLYNQNHQQEQSLSFLYRGQGMQREEFEKLQHSIGGLLSFNAFLSTSTDFDVAHMYAETMLSATDTLAVFLQIDVKVDNIGNNVFADISNLAHFTDEQEYLFSMGTIFRIISIEQESNGIYFVKLRLTSDRDEELAYLKWFMDTNLHLTHHRGPLFRLAGLMNDMSQHSYADYFFTLLLQDDDIKDQPCMLASIHGNMAYMYREKGDLKNAFQHYEFALKLYEENATNDNNQTIAILLANLGEIYIAQGQFDRAIENYERALAIDMNPANDKKPNPEYISNRYNQLGIICERTGHFDKALDYYEKCLQMRLQNMPQNHPDLLAPYNNIALLYDRLGQSQKALDIYMRILEISTSSLPPGHLKFATLYHNIACNLEDVNRFIEALIYAQKAFDIVEKSPLLPTHEIFIGNHEHLKHLQSIVRNMS
ncbi:unnamed protein product [Rotaria magnacalcarata]|uniref:NAD(P)(+)--arginine ADP-ribosyltransferase n=4 Tax=Rotaria magnacalcarata TaxID=392030 RepID=A0A816M8F8_9BILA|nr:unnamed protein product [Rotaria magnacalcarata]CAF2249998.1 unnamed protein product [Rotaria magnacalcarata]CAF3859638.1 unnamed protein product [Rotaria magnacalcarata]CAF3915422.1 unnamed protein product [Rotaria magnacalcarata]